MVKLSCKFIAHLVLLLNCTIQVSISCYISATDSGTCTTASTDPKWRSVNLPFCQSIVIYPACIPKSHPIPPSREFPYGESILYF